MRLLLVAATEAEIAPLTKEMRWYQDIQPNLKSYEIAGKTVDVLITGVGMTATAAWVAKALAAEKYAGALNVGICGSFDHTIASGSVVRVSEDCVAQLGAEDGDAFISVFDLGLADKDSAPYAQGKLRCMQTEIFSTLNNLQAVRGISVNRVHGNDATIAAVVQRLNPQIESMEGAGFYFACAIFNVASLQVRAVSNYVERRNRENWKIGDAVKNLNDAILNYLRTT